MFNPCPISTMCLVQYSDFDCRPGNREKLRYSQAELGPAIRSAVAYFADISGGATGLRDLYIDMDCPCRKDSLRCRTVNNLYFECDVANVCVRGYEKAFTQPLPKINVQFTNPNKS